MLECSTKSIYSKTSLILRDKGQDNGQKTYSLILEVLPLKDDIFSY